MSEDCKEKIFSNYSSRGCARKAVTDGYCKQHHPDNVKARREKADSNRRQKFENSPIAVARRTIESQERDIAELVDFVLMFRKDRLNNPSGIISSSTDNTAGKLTTKHKGQSHE